LTALSDGTFLALDASRFMEAMERHKDARSMAVGYAVQFHKIVTGHDELSDLIVMKVSMKRASGRGTLVPALGRGLSLRSEDTIARERTEESVL